MIVEDMRSRRRSASAVLLVVWTAAAAHLVSPASAGAAVGRWSSHGPEGGFVSALSVDPTDPATVYAGTQDGGVFKTDDGGRRGRVRSVGLPSGWPGGAMPV